MSGVAKLKGAPVVHSRPLRRIEKIAKILDGEDVCFSLLLEVASSAEDKRHGLMGRKKLPSICGMLFENLSGGGYFWMKNCIIPLDVIFLDKDNRITKTYSMPADDGKRRYEYDEDDVSAIEMQYGLCQKYEVVAGLKVEITGIPKAKEVRDGD